MTFRTLGWLFLAEVRNALKEKNTSIIISINWGLGSNVFCESVNHVGFHEKGLRFKFFQLALILHTSQVNLVGFHEKGLRFKFFQLALILRTSQVNHV
jgi:hypothetical protein